MQNDILETTKRRKLYYQIYLTIVKANMWVKAIYKPSCPMDKTHLSPLIFSVRKLGNKLLSLADELENLYNKEETNA